MNFLWGTLSPHNVLNGLRLGNVNRRVAITTSVLALFNIDYRRMTGNNSKRYGTNRIYVANAA